jgi:hypothetical protein
MAPAAPRGGGAMKLHPVLIGELLRRCGSCASFQRCREFLDSGAREGYEEFCPMAAFVRQASALAS